MSRPQNVHEQLAEEKRRGELLKRNEERERLRLETRARDLRIVLGSPEGRRVIGYLLFTQCGLMSPSFTGNSEGFYREGRRSIAIELHQEIKAQQPRLWNALVSECLQAEEQDNE